jgi:hypothetical protein
MIHMAFLVCATDAGTGSRSGVGEISRPVRGRFIIAIRAVASLYARSGIARRSNWLGDRDADGRDARRRAEQRFVRSRARVTFLCCCKEK